MVEAQSISEQSDHSSKHQVETHWNLASLHEEYDGNRHNGQTHGGSFRQQDAPANGGADNNYVYFGDTATNGRQPNAGDNSKPQTDNTAPAPRTNDATTAPATSDNSNQDGTKVTLKSGDTFWGLSAQYYPGQTPPIEAIYEANGLMPQIKTDANGHQELVEPTYYAGKTYVMPPASEIQQLTEQYRNQVQQLKDSPSRVGGPNDETKVQLIYGDTLSALSQAKYGDANAPLAAIYEANGMTPKLEQGSDGQLKLVPPTYYSGQTFTLPSETDIPKLEQQFYAKIGHPELLPQQYQNAINGSGAPTDNSGAPTDNSGQGGSGSAGQTTSGGWELPGNASGASGAGIGQAGGDATSTNGGAQTNGDGAASTSSNAHTSGGWELPSNASGGGSASGASGDATQSGPQTRTTSGGWAVPGSASSSSQSDATPASNSGAPTSGGWSIPSAAGGGSGSGSNAPSDTSSANGTENSDGSNVATIGDALNNGY